MYPMATRTLITSIVVTIREQADQGDKDEDNDLEPQPLGRFVSDGGRDHVRDRWAAASFRQSQWGPSLSHYQRMGTHPLLDHRRVLLRPARPCGDLRQAGGEGRLAWPGWLSPV